ncbi:hypothetical protein SERLA73DRAFT_185073 [Serpula lacrymans var. lacrymans S7.3]|uniref:Uncharacterized protein n=2 Tax=Serpula lacrymans var. lacrymans TaxID=341189 RepID=F8Q406_SERL3|nr:uncharacterized protein SERLADRAFT_473313 [Serpula lacrymans var. lacrymans S7.9]EGN96862.1 hypothetical protein SERLA73DRAFT_185073 [Serpula lacrymans var. lacrymans S7.3]EGO22461.1 hypothetical protein SERLADRAFT_473313 [Serpula lacrymans var. lacrymans S7.9]
MLQRAWQFIGGSASDSDADINVVMRIMPKHKVKCLMFYKTLLGYWYPRVDQDFYIEFGFCAYDEPGQSWLGFRYMDLINACTFDEFCDAYKSSSILSRLDLAIGCNMFCSNNCPDLSDVLHGSPDMFKSVWYLIQMLNAEVPKEVPAVMVDYGFVNCRDEGERKALMDVYRKVLRMSKPLKLHEAAVQGKLFDYAGGLVKLKKKFKRLMKNPYPSASF